MIKDGRTMLAEMDYYLVLLHWYKTAAKKSKRGLGRKSRTNDARYVANIVWYALDDASSFSLEH